MGTTLNRHAYQRLIDEDLEWLSKQPRTLERDHIEAIVRISPKREYETECNLCHEPLAFCRCRTIGRITIDRETETERFERVSELPSPASDAAPASPAAPKEEAQCYWCKHPDHGEKVCPVPYLARGEHGLAGSYPCGCTQSTVLATTPSPDATREAAARKYFCSCGGALTAEEYIEHYFKKGHDRGESQLLASGAAKDIMDYFARSERWTDKPIDGVIRIIQRHCFPAGGESESAERNTKHE